MLCIEILVFLLYYHQIDINNKPYNDLHNYRMPHNNLEGIAIKTKLLD